MNSSVTAIARMDPFTKPLPLTDADVDRLEELLESDVFRGEAMLLDELQGFLCGVVSGPELVPVSAWLPVALGEEPQYESDEQVSEVLDLILRFYSQIATELSEGRVPDVILYPAEEEDGTYDYAPWADGYLLGSDMGATPWVEAAGEHAEELAGLLEPFFLLNGSLKEDICEAGERWLSEAEEARALRSAEEELPSLVVMIHDFWKAKTAAPETLVRDSDKIGRNQACPCGSGRKFKQCCGDPKRMH